MPFTESVFKRNYAGSADFLNTIIEPIFGQYKERNENILSTNKYIVDAAKAANIENIMRIAEIDLYNDDEEDRVLQVFDITLNEHARLVNNRVGIKRVLIRLMEERTAAIMVFHYANNEGDWRISFVHKEYSQSEVTAPKRYTFLVGSKHTCRTISLRFTQLAIDYNTKCIGKGEEKGKQIGRASCRERV